MINNIAIIIARGGSKRIPGKNSRSFLGKPILSYSIETALKSNLFTEVMVSTDDEYIAELAKQYGAELPFMRSKKNADDFASTSHVIIEVLEEYKKNGKVFANACCIYPTAPFIKTSSLKDAYDKLVKEHFDSVFPVCSFSYPILRSLHLDVNGKVEMNWPENYEKRSQDLPTAYHDAGQFYWVDTEKFLQHGNLFNENSGAIVLNEMEVQDIDNETDWKIAELKYSLLINDK